MKLLNVAVLASSITLLSGCALTEFARDYFDNAVDMNQYEAAKEIDASLCDPDVLNRLQKTRTREWYLATVKDCTSRKEKSVPLAN